EAFSRAVLGFRSETLGIGFARDRASMLVDHIQEPAQPAKTTLVIDSVGIARAARHHRSHRRAARARLHEDAVVVGLFGGDARSPPARHRGPLASRTHPLQAPRLFRLPLEVRLHAGIPKIRPALGVDAADVVEAEGTAPRVGAREGRFAVAAGGLAAAAGFGGEGALVAAFVAATPLAVHVVEARHA